MGKMSTQEAWEWYRAQPWIRGWCGYPSNCVNRIAMWQEYKHAEVFEQIEREFALAKQTGFNAVRAIIQFEVWQYEHDGFMKNLEEYFCLADKYGLKVMLTLGNDCTVPKSDYIPAKLGEQTVDWGYHSGIKRGPHTGDFQEPGYCLLDDPAFERQYYCMVDEIAAKYARDERLQIWDIWNEPGASWRVNKSTAAMEKFFDIVRSHNPIQPLTATVWCWSKDNRECIDIERKAIELSDVITFHCYFSFERLVQIVEYLRSFDKPLICNEWLNRLESNDVACVFPFFYIERIGSYHWGLQAGYSQTYEPWGQYYTEYLKEGSTLELFKWQHDLYRMNGLPYDPKEIRLIQKFCALADSRDAQCKR